MSLTLTIESLSKTYPNGVRALNDVSLQIPTGMFGLLGPNGAGKGTLMRIIATLQEPDVTLGDLDVLREKDRVRPLLGCLPQEFGVYPRLSAQAMLTHLAVLEGVPPSELKDTVEALLRQTNLWDDRKKRLDTFSGGMKQRFGIAQALLGDPKLIIVDEPTAGLDPTERLRFHNLLSQIGENIVVILSTHIVEDVSDLCSRMAIISKGEVLLTGDPASAIYAIHRMPGRRFRSLHGLRLRATMSSMSVTRYGFPLPDKASITVLIVSGAVLAAQLSGCAAAPPDEQPPPPSAGPEAVAGWQMVDLSHAYGGDTLYWPTDTDGFRLDTLAEGEAAGGYFYAAKAFATAEHGGTHLDAPFHFAEGGDDAATIPLDRLILPGIVIDVSEAAAADPDYLVTVEDVTAWEEEHGQVPAGSAVLIRTGWAARWPDALAYLGDDTPGETANLHFPGIGTASIDRGQSTDFIAHQIGAAAGVPNLENVADLSGLPPTGFLLVALPMKIEDGTGAPVRIVALIP